MNAGTPLNSNAVRSQSNGQAVVYFAAAFAALGGLLFGYDT